MFRFTQILAAAALIALTVPGMLEAQIEPIPSEMEARRLPRQRLNGPRFGFTVFTGDVAKYRQALDKQPLMSQFGWQFETQIVSTESGNQALMEWIILLGGLEQSERNLSLTWMAGYRLPNGLELGVGPNISVRPAEDPEKTIASTTSMVIAAGATLPFGELYVPANLAVAFAEGGPRITTLLGWIIG
jgi:hypothetical protein